MDDTEIASEMDAEPAPEEEQTPGPLDPGVIMDHACQRFVSSSSHQDPWRAMARESFAFVAGDQWEAEDLEKMKADMRLPVKFNRIAPMIDAVAGQEAQNRTQLTYKPREPGDVKTNEILTGAAAWVEDECDAQTEDSDAFWDMLVCGLGWTETRLDWDEDPAGDIIIERVDPLEIFWDPAASKRNMTNARYVFRVKDMLRGDAMALFPEWNGTTGGSAIWGEPDSEITVPNIREDGDQYGGAGANVDGYTKIPHVRVVEYQWKERETVFSIFDPSSQKMVDLSPEHAERMIKFFLEQGQPAPMEQRSALVTYRAFIIGTQVVWSGKNVKPDGFTFAAITGKRDRNNKWWYGLVEPMKDPQRWANKFFSELLHLFRTNAKGGIMAEQGAIPNVSEFEANWARNDRVSILTPGALRDGKIKEKPVGQLPAVVADMQMMALGAMREVTGINPEMLGMVNREQAGVVEESRKTSSLAIMAPLFDSLQRYRRQRGKILLYFIQEYISDNRLIRILGEDGEAKYVQLSKQPDTITYDVIVDESPYSPNQRERTWAMLVQMLPAIYQSNMDPVMMMEILRASPLPSSLVSRIEAKLAARPKDPMAEQAKMLALQKEASEVEENKAQAMQQKAKAAATMAEIPGAKADAALARVKALATMAEIPRKAAGLPPQSSR